MRMKTISETRTLRDVSNEFLAYKKARKVRERTLRDYQKYIDKFIEQYIISPFKLISDGLIFVTYDHYRTFYEIV